MNLARMHEDRAGEKEEARQGLKYFQLNRSLFASGYVGKIKARFGKINAPHHGMYHL